MNVKKVNPPVVKFTPSKLVDAIGKETAAHFSPKGLDFWCFRTSPDAPQQQHCCDVLNMLISGKFKPLTQKQRLEVATQVMKGMTDKDGKPVQPRAYSDPELAILCAGRVPAAARGGKIQEGRFRLNQEQFVAAKRICAALKLETVYHNSARASRAASVLESAPETANVEQQDAVSE